MKVTILGCGGSGGVPMIGGEWGECDPKNPLNRRSRASILVEEGDTTLLIDTSPDLRTQLLRENTQKVSAVLYTHAHADHCHGIDDLRAMNWHMKAPIDIYGDAPCIETLTSRFDYIFKPKPEAERYYKPALVPHIITPGTPLEFPPLTVLPFPQDHAYLNSMGYRIGNFAYSTDCKTLSDATFKLLEGLDTWVVDCARRREHPTHSHLDQTLAWIERVKPKRAWLTHMGTELDYEALCKQLPPHIKPAHDGLNIEILV
jgi:phosphoribosyl 1,2-cyclic phosphate phosphodiesterase